jgi:hypothetical protein
LARQSALDAGACARSFFVGSQFVDLAKIRDFGENPRFWRNLAILARNRVFPEIALKTFAKAMAPSHVANGALKVALWRFSDKNQMFMRRITAHGQRWIF